MTQILTRQDAIDLWEGTKILGCGGGGEPNDGLKYIEETYDDGHSFTLAQVDQLPPNELVVTIGLVGGGISEAELREVQGLPLKGIAVLRAIEALEEYLERPIGAYMPCEPGAGNSFVPLYAAAMKGAVAVDLDTAGRAKPEIVNSTTSIFDVPLTPLAIASDYGDVLILREAPNERRVEQICRYVARASGGMCAVARCPITVEEARGRLISGSLQRALAAGRAIRTTADPVEGLIEALHGRRTFDGTIRHCTRREEGGFVWGEIELSGRNGFANETYKLYYKNENLIGWRNDEPDATTPDLLSVVDSSTGKGVYNWTDESLYCGREVTVIWAEAHPLWLSQRGLELFGPRHFGFDFDYVKNASASNE